MDSSNGCDSRFGLARPVSIKSIETLRRVEGGGLALAKREIRVTE
jgi:hypothetical protein